MRIEFAASVGVTWKAVPSDCSTDAISRFNPTAPV